MVKRLQSTAGTVFATLKNPYLNATDWGWQIDPTGLKICTLNSNYMIDINNL